MFVLVYLFVNGASYVAFDERIMYYLPISIYLSTKMWMYYTWFQAGALEYRHLLYPVFRIRIRLDPDSNCQTGSGSVFGIRIRIRNPDPDW